MDTYDKIKRACEDFKATTGGVRPKYLYVGERIHSQMVHECNSGKPYDERVHILPETFRVHEMEVVEVSKLDWLGVGI